MEKKKMKLWKKIVVVIFAIFIALTVRKILIISNLQNKISMYTESTNCYAKTSLYQGDYWIITECYMKEDSYILYLTNISKENTHKLINYSSDGIKVNTYIETNEDKVAILDSNGLPSKTSVVDYLYTNNFFELLLNSITVSIKTEKCNGKDCYFIKGIISSNMLMQAGKNGVYIEKETGLPVRFYNGTTTNSEGETVNNIIDYKYEFNVVTEQDIIEPDVSQYHIAEDNT